MKSEIPVYTLHLPECQVDQEPDHEEIGRKVDDFIRKIFLGEHIAVRCLGSLEHPSKTIDEIIDIIKKPAPTDMIQHARGTDTKTKKESI